MHVVLTWCLFLFFANIFLLLWIALLQQLGVARAEAQRLKRWDRIHMIREIINRLDKEGKLPQALKKYVRDSNNNNAYVESDDEEGGERGLRLFKKVCGEIWRRQKAALSEVNIPGGGIVAGAGGVSPLSNDGDNDDSDLEGELERRATQHSQGALAAASGGLSPQGCSEASSQVS
mgnify:CR=1 FL=1